MDFEHALPLIFAGLMALSLLLYAILDGYDLGVGLMLPFADEAERDMMIASIGPFWDANETWLVLGVGLLLIAFPAAHSQIMGAVYLPILLLLIGLILRGVAFDFRAKVPARRKAMWDRLFFVGSLSASLAQGYVLGLYVVGFDEGRLATLFALLSAVCVTSAYAFIGGGWLVMKTEGALQQRAARWALRCLWLVVLGIGSVSIVNPLVSPEIFAKWFSLPEAIMLMPIPLLCATALLGVGIYLRQFLRAQTHHNTWLPFAGAVLVFALSFQGLAYSFYPYVVPFEVTVWEAAAATSALQFTLWGVLIVFPVILAYTFVSYRVFWGKARELRYY